MQVRSVFDRELNKLNQDLVQMSSLVEYAIKGSITCLEEGNPELAEEIIQGDDQIDELERAIEKRCLRLLLRQQPVAHDFRAVTAALKMITDVERIGDQAADIAALSLNFVDFNQVKELTSHIPDLAEIAINMVHDSIKSYINVDLELANQVILLDKKADKLFNDIKRDLVKALREDEKAVDMAIDVLMIGKYLERICDHTVNICEWVEFYVTGEHKSIRIF